MIDNGFQFNWRGMSREPAMAAPQGGANLSNTLGASQAAQMQGYRPLPSMQGYQPTLSGRQVNPDSSPATQPEIAMAQTEHRMKMLMDKYKENEDKIAQLKQEYIQLQQEESTASENLERDIAANRAGIGDSSQYNAWRSRVESREAQDKARQADTESSVRTAKSKLNNALRDLSYARGDRETAVAKQIYEDALAEYNEKARKAGLPEAKASDVANQKTVTMFDTKDFIRQHRDKNGEWDSEENKAEAKRMARALGDDGIQLLDEIEGQITQPEGKAKRSAYAQAVRTEAAKLKGSKPGNTSITVNGKPVPALIKASDTDPDKYEVVVNGKVVYDWRI